MNAITVNGLTKRYKEHTAVDAISFDVRQGDLFALLGENGAGKSTTINMLCTILQPSGGEAQIMGHQLGREDDAIRSSIGIVFQSSVLDRKLTVRDNLLTRAAYYGLTKQEALSRLEPYMQSFELEEIWNSRFENLSGGQRRRVDIIRGLINRPEVLFLDEPTTGLDPRSRRIVWDHIDSLRKNDGLTIILTTHYMEETRDADDVVILDRGRIIAQGTPEKLKSSYTKSRLLWYTQRSQDNDALLAGREYDYSGDHYTVLFTGTVTDLLWEHRDRITDYEIIKGSMDDVFLTLTGKEFAQ